METALDSSVMFRSESLVVIVKSSAILEVPRTRVYIYVCRLRQAADAGLDL
jgi:hypothetical protein